MIDLKECIKYCIDNFDTEEATERLFVFINDSLKLKEQEIEIRNSIKVKNVLKETTIDDLLKNIKSIYSCEHEPCSGKHTVYVDLAVLNSEEKKIIDRFWRKNNKTYTFVFQTRHNYNNY